VYGPALQKTGEKSYGVDVWIKNTPELVLDQRYWIEDVVMMPAVEKLRQENRQRGDSLYRLNSYHNDHGRGSDLYRVGATLGCGTPALIVDDQIVYPYCYKDYKVLEMGPLRFSVQLDYNPTVIGEDTITEHRIITLDKGSNFNKMTVWYEGLVHPIDMAAGVVIHEEDTKTVKCGRDFVAYADPTDNPAAQNFQIYVAALFPNGITETKTLMLDKPQNGIVGHAVGINKRYHNAERYTYYFGSAWSKNDVRNFDEWLLRINSFLEAQATPLVVAIK
jgi:hypothetical protein